MLIPKTGVRRAVMKPELRRFPARLVDAGPGRAGAEVQLANCGAGVDPCAKIHVSRQFCSPAAIRNIPGLVGSREPYEVRIKILESLDRGRFYVGTIGLRPRMSPRFRALGHANLPAENREPSTPCRIDGVCSASVRLGARG